MAVNKPQITIVRSADVDVGGTISFTWHSTLIISSCKFKIYNYTTNASLGTITKKEGITQDGSYNYICSIAPADFLSASMTNAQLYYAELIIEYMDSQGNIAEAPSSGFFVIKCLKTPSFNAVNLNSGQVISTTGFSLEFTYAQNAGERLDEYNITVLDHSNAVVYNSGVIAGSSLLESNPGLSWQSVNIIHQIPELSDGTYTIEIKGVSGSTGVSDNGLQFKTTITPITVKKPSLPTGFSTLALSNNKYQGQIDISSQVAVLTGTGMLYTEETEDISYIDNSSVKLTEEGKYVNFDYNFSTSEDFTLCFAGSDFQEGAPLVVLSSENETLSIYYKEPKIITFNGNSFTVDADSTRSAYFRVDIDGAYGQCTMCSNKITMPNSGDTVEVILTKEESLYSCTAKVEVV